ALRGGSAHAPVCVGRRLARAEEERALHPPPLLAQRMKRGECGVAVACPAVRRPRPETAVEAAGDDDAVLERLPELGRKRQTVLVVDRMLVFAKEHLGARSPYLSPRCST